MGKAITNYLRTHRRKRGLTQSDMAFLLGLRSGQTVARHESLNRKPNLEVMLAYQVLFDAPPHELCPGLYAKVEKITMRRIRALARRLGDKPCDGVALQKREVLEQAVERVGARRARL